MKNYKLEKNDRYDLDPDPKRKKKVWKNGHSRGECHRCLESYENRESTCVERLKEDEERIEIPYPSLLHFSLGTTF